MVGAVLAAVLAVGSVAVATSGDRRQPKSTAPFSVKAGRGEVALLVPHRAGVGGWCLARLSRGGRFEGSGDCRECTRSPSASLEWGPFRGPVITAAPAGGIVVDGGRGRAVAELVVLVDPAVAAITFDHGAPITARADAELPDHLRGAIVKVEGRRGEFTLPQPPKGHIRAWSRSGGVMSQTFRQAAPLADWAGILVL